MKIEWATKIERMQKFGRPVEWFAYFVHNGDNHRVSSAALEEEDVVKELNEKHKAAIAS